MSISIKKQFCSLLMKKLDSETPDHETDKPSRRSLTIFQRKIERKLEATIQEAHGYAEERAWLEQTRPRTRKDCEDGPRPCPYLLCEYNLYLDVNPKTGSIKINFPDRNLDELEETCALDVAKKGGLQLERVGEYVNLTRERVRQIEAEALSHLENERALQEFNPNGQITPSLPTKSSKTDPPKKTSRGRINGSHLDLDQVLGIKIPIDIAEEW